MRLIFAALLLLCLSVAVQAQNIEPAKKQRDVEREVSKFYAEYAADLRGHKKEAVAARYDTRGVYFLGNGEKKLETFEATKKRYLTEWKGPKSFEFKDLSIEVVSTNAAVVVGLFEWQTESGETFKFSYTALLLRQIGGWRIRVEDESMQPPRQ